VKPRVRFRRVCKIAKSNCLLRHALLSRNLSSILNKSRFRSSKTCRSVDLYRYDESIVVWQSVFDSHYFREPVLFFFIYSHMFFDYPVPLFLLPFVFHYYRCSFWVNGPLSLVNEFSDAAFHQLRAFPLPPPPDPVQGCLFKPSNMRFGFRHFDECRTRNRNDLPVQKEKGEMKNDDWRCGIQRISFPGWNLIDKN
jgi:hypothetical protein